MLQGIILIIVKFKNTMLTRGGVHRIFSSAI